jgi:hypothetical protein
MTIRELVIEKKLLEHSFTLYENPFKNCSFCPPSPPILGGTIFKKAFKNARTHQNRYKY